MKSWKVLAVALGCLLLVPVGAAAQSSIAGEVADNTGGVLPGVTVEASSPALIEGSRVAITDGTGQYNLIDLRPGTYSVTYTLPGFGTQVRDELILQTDFNMNIDIVLTVGALEETVTVSGESPVVDVQQVQRVEVLTREVQEAIPTGRSTWSYAALIPGVKVNQPDVGGTGGAQQGVMSANGAGGQGTSVEIDGMLANTMIGDGGWQGYFNPMMTAETSYTTSGITAETQLGGLRINMIPAEGGNQFSGQFFGGGTPASFHSKNENDTASDMGVTQVPHVERIYDFNAAVGGPIFRDKLWFYGSARRNIINNQTLNSTNRDGTPGIDDNSLTSALLRMTYQMTTRSKLSVMFDKVRKRRFHQHLAGQDVLTSSESWTSPHYDTGTAKYTGVLSSRMLVELGFSLVYEDWDPSYQPNIFREIPGGIDGRFYCASTPCFPNEMNSAQFQSQLDTDGWYGVVEHRDAQLAGFRYEAMDRPENNYPHRKSLAGSTSYVTGSHNFKVGFTNTWGNIRKSRDGNGNLYQNYAADPNSFGIVLPFVDASHFAAVDNVAAGLAPGTIGTADSVTVFNNPTVTEGVLDYNGGFYAQDSWTLNKVTLNYGARVDWAKASVPAIGAPQGRFAAGTNFPAVTDLPVFGPDISPRLSVAYDVFGNAKTALKASFGRYPRVVGPDGYGEQFQLNQEALDTRDWFDLHMLADGSGPSGLDPFGTNGDDVAQDWEIGIPVSTVFGVRNPSNPDPNLKRQYADGYSLGLQQEVAAGISMEVNWKSSYQKNTQLTDNLLRNFSDFGGIYGTEGTSVLIPRPAPYVGSVEIFNISSAAGILADNLVSNRDNSGYTAKYEAFEVSANARLRGGGTVFGGWVMEKAFVDDCQAVTREGDDPNALRFCDGSAYPVPFRHEFKMSASYPITLPAIGVVQLAGSVRASYTDQQFEGGELNEGYQVSRSSTLQAAGSNQATYQAPWYSGDVVGSNIVDRAIHPRISTSTSAYDIIMMPGVSSKFMPYWNQVDLNVAKVFNVGSWRYDARLEVFNALNSGVVLGHNREAGRGTSFGGQSAANYERASRILDGRVIRVAMTARF